MRKVSDERRRQAGREAYVRRVNQGQVDNTYLNFDDWYERYAINDAIFISIMDELENADNSGYDSPVETPTYDNSSYQSDHSSSSSSDSGSYDSGSSDSGSSSSD